MIKAYVYDSEEFSFYLERWQIAADSTIRYIGSHPYGHPQWALLPYWEGSTLSNAMDSLSWFAGGNFILGGMVTNNQTLINYGLSIADAGGAVYQITATGLGGEYVIWTEDCDSDWGENCDASSSMRISDGQYKLRPEAMETWYYAYRATKNPKYREWIWAAFEAILTYCKTDSGFSAIHDVNKPGGGEKLDQMESFVFAEVMKYVYLVHLEVSEPFQLRGVLVLTFKKDSESPLQVQDSTSGKKNTWIFNTEAHPLKVVGPPV